MDERDWLAERFETHRAHLRAVAYRMLGSPSEADDAVQEAWLRLSRSAADEVTNLGGWLTTVVGRVCLDMLRSRTSRREDPLDDHVPETDRDAADPERDVLLADAVGPALLVVLDALSPAERIAFVLHDMFAVPFTDIAPIVGRSPTAARQLASRARRRVRGAAVPDGDRSRQRKVVDAFLAASRGGDFAALLAVLDPDVVLHADEVAVRGAAASADRGAPTLAVEQRGAPTVAETFAGRATAARPALLGGAPGAVWAPDGTPRVAFAFTVRDGRITAIDVVADPDRLARLDVVLLDG
ncbi:RNA polymerase sigma-70 factor, ECF subfamily [Amycolatopsis arida]|uniref:RNA polymerase sigma-70 factor, ECF subfamily n=1 Tax=Amycolatopsis arida TaxID=587909 RepID=A0A1I5QDZ7_9PSEU|nr:sigma-70 family RNA polymerase sigma factor [Amycolatopsis arida]TDX98805.1 RNA polymerase sigma-70 factor (ECF subfamily) [Amycolatopsis arida]SFP44495.1 RNA polymerase sigma-70 factor, ECF subfamily [Amycolatopsis arida]